MQTKQLALDIATIALLIAIVIGVVRSEETVKQMARAWACGVAGTHPEIKPPPGACDGEKK